MADGDPRPDGDAHDAVAFLDLVAKADTNNRQQGLEDLRFSYGDQWPAENLLSRNIDDRPALVINETDANCRQITNAMRQQRPRIKVHPVDDFADKKTAKVITGLCRHVEVNSNADIAYDLAGDFAVRMGWGYWRLRTDYIRENSFDQDIFIDPIYNPFSVYFDPNSVMLDGSDAERCVITDEMQKDLFRKEFPGARMAPFTARSSGDTENEWMTEDSIRLAEFFQVERKKARLVRLSDGKRNMDLYEDEMPPAAMMKELGIRLVGERPSYKRVIKWQKQTAFEILEQKIMPGRWIPVVPCYGVRVWMEGRMNKFGAVRFARDPQIMVNFWNTAITECVAQAPKAKWLMVAGQGDGFENQFSKANVTANPILYYNAVDVEGKPAPPPQYIQPQAAPQGMLVALQGANMNLQRVMGQMSSDEPRPGMFPKSARLADKERGQSEQSNYHFYDNLTVSVCHTGKIILDWAPTTWDVQMVKRIIGEDGKPDLVTINEKKSEGGVETVLNDVTVGTYDVVMQTGPGYDTKREEGLDTFMQVLGTPLGEVVAQTSADVVVRMMDVHGAEEIADRLAASNPLAQIDDKSDVPPQAQMQLKAQAEQIKQMGQAIQALEIEKKFGIEKEGIKQTGETKRTLMKVTGDVHKAEVQNEGMLAVENAENEAWMRDVAMNVQAKLTVAEINAFVKLITTKQQGEISDRAAERQIEAKADEAKNSTT